MKILKYTGIVFLILILLFVVLPVVLLQIPAVQRGLANNVANLIESKIDSRVEIEKIEFRSINKLELRGVFVEDQQGDTLFLANRVAAGIELLPVLRRQYRINSVQLYSFDLRLRRDTPDTPLNIQYIIDAFSPEEKKKRDPVELNIKKIHIHAGQLSYDVGSKEFISGRLNVNHISVDNLSGKIRLNKLKNNRIDIAVDELKFEERSGFEALDISFDLATTPEHAHIGKFLAEFPGSRIMLEDVKASYNGYNQLLTEDTELSATVHFSKIDFNDLALLQPQLSVFGNNVFLEANVTGTLGDLIVNDIHFKENNGSFMRGYFNIKNLTSESKKLYINGEVKNSLFRANYLKELAIAEELERVGDITFKGSLSGYLSDLLAIGEIGTDIGILTADFRFGQQSEHFIKGHIASSGFEIGYLLDNPDLGRIVFDFNLHSKWKGKTYSVELVADIPQFDYQGYAYDGIVINGLFSNNKYNGLISMDGEKGKFAVEGSVELSDADSEYRILIDANNVQLDQLRFARKYDNPALSLTGNINLKGNDFDNIDGYFRLYDFSFITDKESFHMDSISMDVNRRIETDHVIVRSDILDAEIEGNYSIRDITAQLKRSMACYLPSLVRDTITLPGENENRFNFHAIVGDTQDLFSLLKLPFRMSDGFIISGFYNNLDNQLHAEAFMPHFDVADFKIDSCFIELDNRNEELQLNIVGTNLQKESYLNIDARFLAKNDSIRSQVGWLSSKEDRFEGLLDMQAHLILDPGLKGDVRLNRTEMIFNDSVWTLHPTHIYVDKDLIAIDKLRAEHASQFVYIDGKISPQPEDKLLAELGSVDLEYIFNTLDIPALEFGGKATGIIMANDLYRTRELNTQLDITGFTFNNTLFGDMNLNGTWLDEQQGIKLEGHVAKGDSSFIDIDGIIYPVANELSIHFHPLNADMAFLRKYVNNIAKDLSGDVSGHVHLMGKLNDPTVEGEVDIKNGRFGIEFLNTWYNFDHHISMTPSRISANNMVLNDDYGNTAYANAWVTHNLFADFRYKTDLSFTNFFVFNATEKTNPVFYGQAFGTGAATISGTERNVDISANIQNTGNTHITFNFMDKRDIEEYNFITFKDKSHPEVKSQQPLIAAQKDGIRRRNRKPEGGETDIRINISANINNGAQIEAIVDPIAGDMISGNGNGHLEIQYGTNEPLKLMGKYTIEQGQYDFSLEQLYFRKFTIYEGSSINFMGDLMQATLDVKAAYRVQASLSDLDQQLMTSTARGKVPVDCVININGQLEHPAISFDIELPDAPAELERQVKRYISTEDMLNRQMLYLLALNRFYTSPEYATSNTRTNNDLSLLTSTLSNQLTNLLGSLNDKVQIGTQFHQSHEGDQTWTEVELMLSSMLFNNRLILYGNLGYIDNPYISGANGNNVPLVGDFDVEYKLTPNGDIRLKGFNHYNYRNYFSIAPEWTQGIGILFRRDFDNFFDLFGKKKTKSE